MEKQKKDNLEADGWTVGTVEDFLGLTPEEMRIIDLKIALGGFLREERTQAGLSQKRLAGSLGTDQGRVSKMENGDPGVSLDQFVLAFLACGATVEHVGALMGKPAPARATAAKRGARRVA